MKDSAEIRIGRKAESLHGVRSLFPQWISNPGGCLTYKGQTSGPLCCQDDVTIAKGTPCISDRIPNII